MAKKTIVTIPAVEADSGNGTPLATAFQWINENFTELYDADASDVDSVNGQTGTVVLDTDDISEGATNLYNYNHTGEVTGATALTITNGAVTNAKMAANSVDSDQYVDGSIDTEHFSLTAAINTVTDQNTGALKLWSGSQAAYDGLTPDASTIYFIV